MALPTLAEMLSLPTQDAVLEQEVLPEARARGLRVTDWLVGGAFRILAYIVARMRTDDRQTIATFAAANFEDYVFGLTELPVDFTDEMRADLQLWAPIVAHNRYGTDRIEATHTTRTIRLTNASATPYGPIQAGRIILLFTATGNRYISDATYTSLGNDAVNVVFRSEFAVDSTVGRTYLDASGAAITIVTASLPGVTATNPAPLYSPVAHVGSGIGSLTLGGASGGTHSVAVRIDATGIAGVATWSTKVDSGAWVSQGAALSVVNLGGFLINITLADNGGAPSFVAGEFYYFQTPGSDVVQRGRDVETAAELGTRCRALWPSLAFPKDAAGNVVWTSPTASAYEALARSASTQVKVAFVPVPTSSNLVKIYVAGQGALLGVGVMAGIQAFIESRTMTTDEVEVVAPATRAITLGGMTVTVKAALLASAKVAMQLSIGRYLGGVDDANPLTVNGRVDHAYLLSLIRRTPGVVKITDTTFTVNAAIADLQLPVTPGAFELATWGQSVATTFSWATA